MGKLENIIISTMAFQWRHIMHGRRIRALALVAIAALASVPLCFGGAAAEGLSDRQMSRIFGKEGCYCLNTEDCGPTCVASGGSCSGCSGACSTYSVSGTRPKCCRGQTQQPHTCDPGGQVTCTTTITCKTTPMDDKSCGEDDKCFGPTDSVCSFCSNGTTDPDKLTTYVCNSGS